MSLTIRYQPQELMPTYNEVVIVATSSLQTQPNYQLVADVYCRNKYIVRAKVAPNPDGYMVFDLHKHLENQVSFDLNPLNTGITIATNSFATYSVIFSHEFTPEWYFTDNIFDGGDVAFYNINQQPYFSVGDEIFIAQTTPFTHSEYEGAATITGITYSGATFGWVVTIDKGFAGNTPPNPGTMSLAQYGVVNIPISNSDVIYNLVEEGCNCIEIFIDGSWVTNAELSKYIYNEYGVYQFTYNSTYSTNSQYWMFYGSIGGGDNHDGWTIVNGNFYHSAQDWAYGPTSACPIAAWSATGSNPGGLNTYGCATPSYTNITNECYVFNGVLSFEDFINWNSNIYDAQSGQKNFGKFFTEVPENYELDFDSSMYLNFWANANNEVRYIRVKTNLGTYNINNQYNSISSDQNRFLQVAVGPKQLYELGWIDDTTTSYKVWGINQITSQTIATYSFVITNNCSRYEKIQLLFMDKLGSFVPYTFDRVHRHNKTIAKTDYQQVYGQYARSAQNWKYRSYDRGRKSLDTVVNEVYTINSNWMDQKTSNYIMTLFESPEVYWIKEDGTMLAINIISTATERKQTINDQILNYTLQFELSAKNKSQRG